jgi:hypothetical protein
VGPIFSSNPVIENVLVVVDTCSEEEEFVLAAVRVDEIVGCLTI